MRLGATSISNPEKKVVRTMSMIPPSSAGNAEKTERQNAGFPLKGPAKFVRVIGSDLEINNCTITFFGAHTVEVRDADNNKWVLPTSRVIVCR